MWGLTCTEAVQLLSCATKRADSAALVVTTALLALVGVVEEWLLGNAKPPACMGISKLSRPPGRLVATV